MNKIKTNAVKVSKKEMNELNWTRQMKLDYYCNLNNMVTIATGNTKLGSQVCGLSMPPIMTCRKNAPCKQGCYATKGTQQFAGVLGTYMKNLRIWKETPELFFEQISSYLKYSGYKYTRLFDSGDIPNTTFFQDFIGKVVNQNPNVQFMGYTKKYEIVNDYLSIYKELPKNLTMIFSAWDNTWTVPNPYNMPIAYVQFKDQSKNLQIPTESFECPCGYDKGANCSICYACWKLKPNESVTFHQH